MLLSRQQIARQSVCTTQDSIGDNARFVVISLLGEAEQLDSNGQRPIQTTCDRVSDENPVGRPADGIGITAPYCQLLGASESRLSFWSGSAERAKERLPER